MIYDTCRWPESKWLGNLTFWVLCEGLAKSQRQVEGSISISIFNSNSGGRVGPKEASRLWDGSLARPAFQNVVKLVLEERKSESNKKSGKGVPVSRLIENLPLVLEGVRVYLGAAPSQQYFKGANEGVSEERTEAEAAKWVVDESITSMDLLQMDLTDESALRRKIYKRLEVKDALAELNLPIERPPVINDIDQRNTPRTKVKTSLKSEVDGGGNQHLVEDKQAISSVALERSVPASRVSRVASFASLGAGLAFGMVAEASRRAVGIRGGGKSGAATDGSLILTEANASRIVATLCRVRGAALKLGQILSIQDGAVIGPELQKIFDRVRESADFMPQWQLEQVMRGDLGDNWKDNFGSFSMKPFAAASIGQVHRASLPDGTEVAVKVQYPGVAKSIDSDIRNLLTLMKLLAFLPEGLFVDKIASHMAVELAQECDYKREALCGQRMKELLAPLKVYHVPTVYPDLSATQVLTTEYIRGLTIDQCTALPQNTRNLIASAVLKLCFTELFIHRYMQTDPNWANFLFNPKTQQLGLLDFGATREYRPGFVNTYFKIIDGAARKDREAVLEHSREVGFLTGFESKAMNDAHVESVMLLARPFHEDKNFNFGKQTITSEIQALSGVMLRERLCPPPPEVITFSLPFYKVTKLFPGLQPASKALWAVSARGQAGGRVQLFCDMGGDQGGLQTLS